MMDTANEPDIEIFSSSLPFEADSVADALQQAGIPFYRRIWAGGIEQAQPALPAAFPGLFYLIKVPAAYTEQAQHVIAPLTENTSEDQVWPSTISQKGLKIFRGYAWLYLILMVAYLFIFLLQLFQ